ncbi:MAG: endonuclease/exonuclease/phosphatase family protein [Myxococcales bacterium]|nr:endonuclease/exonuclease/phosphatase family protein [Myxococcales bacterium]
MLPLVLLTTACGGVPEVQGDLLQVMTFNIRWPAPTDGPNQWRFRRDAMAEYLLEADPQLAALQEVADEQLAFLAADGEPLRWAPPANVLMRSARDVAWIDTTTVALPGGDYPRAAVLVAFEWRGRRGTFVAAHLNGGPDALAQVELLLARLAGWPRPWIVAGDFNAFTQPEDRCPVLDRYRVVLCNRAADRLRAAGFVDAWAAVHGEAPGSTGTGFEPPEDRWWPPFDARIDWIMATPEAVPVAVEIDDPLTPADRPLSDHRPVRAWFRLPGPAPTARSPGT